jgi:hypothetical protein
MKEFLDTLSKIMLVLVWGTVFVGFMLFLMWLIGIAAGGM